MSAHCVSFLIYPGVASLDVSGPAQALAVAGRRGCYRGYTTIFARWPH